MGTYSSILQIVTFGTVTVKWRCSTVMVRQLERDTKVDFSLHCHRVSHTVTLQRESCIVRGWCGDVIAVTDWYVQKGFQHRDVNVTLTATRQYSHVVEKNLAVYICSEISKNPTLWCHEAV